MKLRKKKGFTIVELVIVIAVIAILAAVLIPTFANLIARANESADIQAVKEMNTQLAIAEVDSTIATIGDAINALKKVNINMENYTPLRADTQFYWVKSLNRVIYVDLAAGNKVLFPKEYENLTQEKGDWYALNGKIKYEDYAANISDEGGSKTLSVSSAGQFAKFVNDFNAQTSKEGAKAVTKITLTQDIDLAGATCKFTLSPDCTSYAQGLAGATGSASNKINIEIDGGNHTIYGFRDDSETFVYSNGDSYGYGLFGVIGYFDVVTIKNVIFSDMHVEDTQNDGSKTSGLIAGYLYGKLTLENVKFKDCKVSGFGQIGTIGGQCYETDVTMKNVTFENTVVSGSWATAKILGSLNNGYGKLTVNDACNFDGIKVIDRDGTGTVKQSDIKAADGSDLPFVGDSNNKYTADSDGDVYGCVPNDWVWYFTTEHSGLGYAKPVKVNGQNYKFYLNVDSASKNIVNGVPVN